MDQVTRARKYLKREQWSALIPDCQSSGMTVTAWCKQNGTCKQTYYRNLRKLREEACGSFPVPAQSDKPAVFKQLQLQQPVPDGKAAILTHLPYATLEVHNRACRETLEAALAALKSTCQAISKQPNRFTLPVATQICASPLMALPHWSRNSSVWILPPHPCPCSAVADVTASRPCRGRGTDLSSCISG